MSDIFDRNKLVFLTEQLGPTITAALSGTRNRADVSKWANEQAAPSPEQSKRINFAYSCIERARDAKGDDVGARMARAWFIGGNVGENLDTPMTGIREDRFGEVDTSLASLLDDNYFGAYSHETAEMVEKYCGIHLII